MSDAAKTHIDATHDPSLQSWVESANAPATDFPLQNLPLCAFEHVHDGHTHGALGIRIGESILDLTMLVEAGHFQDDEELEQCLSVPFWNAVASEPAVWGRLRQRVQRLLQADAPVGQPVRRLREKAVRPAADFKLILPMSIFNYTDFYASKHHATNVGSMFRPDNPLLPNYKHVPIGYHGRASSIVESGFAITRPKGQQSPPEGVPGALPSFGPCTMLDYELEMGVFVGAGNDIGSPIEMRDIADQIFGLCIVNDWSARDMQKWEYQPLGPFLAKNFATSISPYVVTMAALQPFRTPGPERATDDPTVLDYLKHDPAHPWGLDVQLEVHLQSQQMRDRSMAPIRISTGNFKHMYWTLAQMLVHHASNGCNMCPGDLLASGTVSGPERESRGCLLELTWDGPPHLGADGKPKPRRPLELPTGEKRTFLQDGDEVIMKAFCERSGYRRVGFGECRGRILPAK